MREYREYFSYSAHGREPFMSSWPPVTKWLLIANIVVFGLDLLVVRFLLPTFFGVTIETAVVDLLGLKPELAVMRLHVWQFVTYTYLHSLDNLLHLIFNMLFLYWFGREVEHVYGGKRFFLLYTLGGVAAGLAYVSINFVSAFSSPVIGASGSVMAVLVVYTLHFPRREILFFFLIRMEVWVFTLIIIGMDLAYSMTAVSNGVANIAHLGGAVFGWVFYRYQGAVTRYFEMLEREAEKREIQQAEELEAKVDELLDKIAKTGMMSLTKKEREFLKRASKHYQDKGTPH